jgi:predicted nuclease of restriction endonuclease-like (RecB) superfamily
MLLLYWDIGQMIEIRQKEEGWGAGVIPRLSRDLKNELPEVKGYSERNLKRMIRFYREYPLLRNEVPQAVAQLSDQAGNEKVPQPVAQLEPSELWDENMQEYILNLPWGQNFLLIEKFKDLSLRCWYMRESLKNGWGRDMLAMMIKSKEHERQGRAISNFELLLPSPQSDMAKQTLKDPYIFDFLTLDTPFRERELELDLIRHLEKFLLEPGQGFAFVGRQYHLSLEEEDFYIDLLFYHLRLRCFFVIDLKTGPFRPEYAGKMNFYLNVVDDRLTNEADNPSIGLILCQDKKKILAEYALRGLNKPIGVSEYELTRTLPDELKSSLPSIEELEKELTEQAEAEEE